MTDSPAEVVESIDPPRRTRNWRRMAVVLTIMLLLFGVPWWTLLASGAVWPTGVFVTGTLLVVAAFIALLSLMMLGHGRRHLDWAAAAGDGLLGATWVLFVWSVLGQLLRLVLLIAGVGDPARSRVAASSSSWWRWCFSCGVMPRRREFRASERSMSPSTDSVSVWMAFASH